MAAYPNQCEVTRNPKEWSSGRKWVLDTEIGTFKANEQTETLWGVYSKKWHRSYGPVRKTLRRWVTWSKLDETEAVDLIDFNAWRGNWQWRALERAGMTKGEYVMMIIQAKLKGEGD